MYHNTATRQVILSFVVRVIFHIRSLPDFNIKIVRLVTGLDELIASPDASEYEFLTMRAYDLAMEIKLAFFDIEEGTSKYLEGLDKKNGTIIAMFPSMN